MLSVADQIPARLVAICEIASRKRIGGNEAGSIYKEAKRLGGVSYIIKILTGVHLHQTLAVCLVHYSLSRHDRFLKTDT